MKNKFHASKVFLATVIFTLMSMVVFSVSGFSSSVSTSNFASTNLAKDETTSPKPATDTKAKDDSLKVSDSVDKKDALEEVDINRFTTAITQIKDFYVNNISDKKLLEDAIRGMLGGLDPHSEYLDEDSYKSLLMTTTGEFGGLGIEVTTEHGVLKVVTPIDDTPASRAGIKTGDYIVAIDGKLVHDMSLREAVEMMRGKKGTNVSLTVLRKGEKAPINYKLAREMINIATVKSNSPIPGFGYIRVSQFQQPTTELMVAAIDKLKKENGGKLKGLVLDLRNNPGGLLDTAVQVADVFLDSRKPNRYNNMIVYTEGRLNSSQFKAKSTPGDILNNAPMVVLVNEGSASASEIVAGALQDYKRAVILGTQTFGKGSVQTVLPLDSTHALKLTTALYHTPSGKVIQNKGIVPDITVEDLKIEKNTSLDNAMIDPIREYNLKGHLQGSKASSKDLADAKNNPLDDGKDMDNGMKDDTTLNDQAALAQKDFQLYEAMKILRGMYIVDTTEFSGPAAAPTTTAEVVKH